MAVLRDVGHVIGAIIGGGMTSIESHFPLCLIVDQPSTPAESLHLYSKTITECFLRTLHYGFNNYFGVHVHPIGRSNETPIRFFSKVTLFCQKMKAMIHHF